VTLPTITASDLPRQAYAHGMEHDPALTHPQKFRPVINTTYDPKPLAGGMWTSTITDVDYTGEIISTAWTEYYQSEDFGQNDYTRFLEIAPAPDFKGLVIDSLSDAATILGTYRVDAEPDFLGGFWAIFNWEQMADDGYDALYLTGHGQGVTRIPDDRSLSLYGWDVESVLWLRPTYRVVTV
jgi:hypothetical protein